MLKKKSLNLRGGDFLVVADDFYEEPVVVKFDKTMPSGRLWVDYGHGETSVPLERVISKLSQKQTEHFLQDHVSGNMYGFAALSLKK